MTYHLKKHEWAGHGEKSQQCNQCERSFAYRYNTKPTRIIGTTKTFGKEPKIWLRPDQTVKEAVVVSDSDDDDDDVEIAIVWGNSGQGRCQWTRHGGLLTSQITKSFRSKFISSWSNSGQTDAHGRAANRSHVRRIPKRNVEERTSFFRSVK